MRYERRELPDDARCTVDEKQLWAKRLEDLGLAIQSHVHQLVSGADQDLALPVAHQGGDTIFEIDRRVEPILERIISGWKGHGNSLEVVCEGLGESGRQKFGHSDSPSDYRLMIDPIDGTRNIMYDKRSAWFLAAIAPERGESTRLKDAVAAVMVELPSSKQGWADCFVAVEGHSTTGRRMRLGSDEARQLDIRPSTATSLEFGFAQVSNFFPGTKLLASDLMERIVGQTLGTVEPGKALVFEDQYITTGGQMVELMLGHDRFCCDLRPLFYDILQRQTGGSVRGLECHPYDVAGLLVAQQAGVILTDGFGRPLDASFSVDEGVHWCGYANEELRQIIAPVIESWLSEHGVVAP